jgi:hypothetical protein
MGCDAVVRYRLQANIEKPGGQKWHSIHHSQSRNHAVEARSLEVQHLSGTALALLPGAETTEVFRGPGDDVGPELHLDPALGGTADGDVEENDRILAHFLDSGGVGSLDTRGERVIHPTTSHECCRRIQ